MDLVGLSLTNRTLSLVLQRTLITQSHRQNHGSHDRQHHVRPDTNAHASVVVGWLRVVSVGAKSSGDVVEHCDCDGRFGVRSGRLGFCSPAVQRHGVGEDEEHHREGKEAPGVGPDVVDLEIWRAGELV